MWYGYIDSKTKAWAEKVSNDLKVQRNQEAIGNIVIKQAVERSRQRERDEATWKEMQRSFPKC